MATAKRKAKSEMGPELAAKILRTVPHHNAFYFFTDVGEYTGKFAVTLSDFCKKIETIDTKSVGFHFKRRDFVKWIRGPVGDADLANEINKISKSLEGEQLRGEIYKILQRRLAELKKLLASAGASVERI